MLPPETRAIATEMLSPPYGQKLDFALLTTYTLDLELLLALPLGMLTQAGTELEDLLEQPLSLLEALRHAGQRIHLFVDEQGIGVPRKERNLFATLESSVHSVRAPGGGVFHPKVWVARFVDEEGNRTLRVVVLSRNLTHDRSWDIALASEAEPDHARHAGSEPLERLLARLPELATTPLGSDLRKRIRGLAREVGKTKFPAPDGFAGIVRFHASGLRGKPHGIRLPQEQGSNLLAMAPFVNDAALDAVRPLGGGSRTLVGRQDELDELSNEVLEDWGYGQLDSEHRILVLADDVEESDDDEPLGHPCGLHAKMLAIEQPQYTVWHFGSANLTTAAWNGRNVELIATLTAPNSSQCGIEDFLNAGFDRLLLPYRKSEQDTRDEEALVWRQTMQEALQALVHADLRAACSGGPSEYVWHLKSRIKLPEGITCRVWPLSVPEWEAQSLDGATPQWTLPVSQLTAFVACSLSAPVKSVGETRMTLKIPVANMPENRTEHILRLLIDSRERFLQFLRLLFGGLDETAARNGTGTGTGGAWGWRFSEDTLLEDLVRTAAQDPKRLEPARKLIRELRKTPEGQAIIPDDLAAAWQAVEAAVQSDTRP